MRTRHALFLCFYCAAALALLPRGAAAQRAVIVVRHAEKQTDSDEASVGLSEAGSARARRLAGLLENAGVTAIYATDTVRAMATVEPLARQLGLEIRKYSPRDARGTIDLAPLAERLKKEHGRDVVLIAGHSNTVPPLLKALGCVEEVRIPTSRYEDVFLVLPGGREPPKLLRLTY